MHFAFLNNTKKMVQKTALNNRGGDKTGKKIAATRLVSSGGGEM